MSNTVKGWLCAIAGMVTMGVSHLCYSIIIILMASMVAAVGCSAAEGALIFSITAIGSLVASLFIGSLLKVLKTKYVYVIGGIPPISCSSTSWHFCLASATSSAVR